MSKRVIFDGKIKLLPKNNDNKKRSRVFSKLIMVTSISLLGGLSLTKAEDDSSSRPKKYKYIWPSESINTKLSGMAFIGEPVEWLNDSDRIKEVYKFLKDDLGAKYENFTVEGDYGPNNIEVMIFSASGFSEKNKDPELVKKMKEAYGQTLIEDNVEITNKDAETMLGYFKQELDPNSIVKIGENEKASKDVVLHAGRSCEIAHCAQQILFHLASGSDVVAYNKPGYGQSDGHVTEETYNNVAREVTKKFARKGGENTIHHGFSLGTGAASAACIQAESPLLIERALPNVTYGILNSVGLLDKPKSIKGRLARKLITSLGKKYFSQGLTHNLEKVNGKVILVEPKDDFLGAERVEKLVRKGHEKNQGIKKDLDVLSVSGGHEASFYSNKEDLKKLREALSKL